MRDSGFVALSRTMVSLLGNAWFTLATHPRNGSGCTHAHHWWHKAWKNLNGLPG